MSKTDDAIKFATDAHAGQRRKLDASPYILHPLEVATIVSKLTDDEDVICAALLHDVVEDTSHDIDEIRKLFGERVAELVNDDTENKRSHLPPTATWQIRKEETLARLRRTDDKAVKILWLGDKLSNMRSIYNAYKKEGDDIWKQFHNSDKNKHKWYYESIADAIRSDLGDSDLFWEYEQRVKLVFGEGDKNENKK